MNANQIINMLLRQVMRRFLNKGINMGMQGVSRSFGQKAVKTTKGDDSTQRSQYSDKDI